MMWMFNPLTGQWLLVLNANPRGDNQYVNLDGPSRPSIAPGKIAKGLAKYRTKQVISMMKKRVNQAPSSALQSIDDPVKSVFKEFLKKPKGKHSAIHHKDIADEIKRILGEEEFIHVKEADELSKAEKANRRAVRSYGASILEGDRNQNLFYKRKDWRTPSTKVIAPLEFRGSNIRMVSPANTPNEYPEYD